ncbi:nucleoside hydrolase [Sphingomonas sp. M6A6_1c]
MTFVEPDRRHVLTGIGTLLLTAVTAPERRSAAASASTVPRARVIIDNDFSGDPDGLFQLAHHLLSPSIMIPFVIGSHIHVGDFLDGSATQADNAAARARALVATIGAGHHPPVFAGRNAASPRGATPMATAITDRILAEARRTDTKVPLVYAAGAGLTELAAAVRADPAIGPRIRLVWIGGREWPDLVTGVPSRLDAEYNITIDVAAARTLFNESAVEIWQVPRNVYRQMLVSMAELRAALRPAGATGAFLLDALDRVRLSQDDRLGETYILGDSPLVTLTALLSSFEPDASSSDYVIRPTPVLNEDGSYTPRLGTRPMRVYRSIDTRLTFADLFAKLATI